MINDDRDRQVSVDRRTVLRRTAGLVTAGAVGTVAAVPGVSAARADTGAVEVCSTSCFSKADNDRLSFDVVRLGWPPVDDVIDCEFPRWPCTEVASTVGFVGSEWSGRKWEMVWANRGTNPAPGEGWNMLPNPLPPPRMVVDELRCMADYTTNERAIAATRCQILALLKRPDFAQPWLDVGGDESDIVTMAQLRADPAAYFTHDKTVGPRPGQNPDLPLRHFKVMIDRPWIRDYNLIDQPDPVEGVMLDYEVIDNRSDEQTTECLETLAADLHAAGLKLFLYTNPLTAGVMPYSGLSRDNLPGLVQDHLDRVTVLSFGGMPGATVVSDYQEQLSILRGSGPTPYSKVVVTYGIGRSNLEHAAQIHQIMTGKCGPAPAALLIWPDGAPLNGPCTPEHAILGTACFGPKD